MAAPVCKVQTVGLYKGHGCISDVMITAALYPPLFMSVGCLYNLPTAASTVRVKQCNASKHPTRHPCQTSDNNNQFRRTGGNYDGTKQQVKLQYK